MRLFVHSFGDSSFAYLGTGLEFCFFFLFIFVVEKALGRTENINYLLNIIIAGY